MSSIREAVAADAGWRDTTRPVIDLFEQRAAADPHHLAFTGATGTVRYGELDARANRLAHWLAGRGVGTEELVAVHLVRGVTQVTAVLAVLKAGGAYVPIDPATPADRVRQILADSGCRLVLCGVEHVTSLRDTGAEPVVVGALDLADLPHHPPDRTLWLDQVAYVVYTSGSTGTPKGVLATHRALTNLAGWISGGCRLGATDVTGMVCSPGFDAAMCELWPSLVSGAVIDVPEADVLLSPSETVGWLAGRGLTVGILPTPLAEPVLREQWPEGLVLRALLTGGDRLHVRPSPELSVELVNNYGPTENTGVSTSGVVDPNGDGLPSIGSAVPGTTVEILDTDLRPVGQGELGEIYLGGAQLARGYLGRPDLTADRFVPHPRPAVPGERLYRTGDLGRWLPDGDIEFVGRDDDQVKVRGTRIEPGEVTAALIGHPQVAAAHVLTHQGPGGDVHLVGYVVPADQRRLPAAGRLREYLRDRLPATMVPTAYVILGELPRNPNGKVDRAALPLPDLRRGNSADGYVAPATATGRAVARIWRDILGVDQVGAEDDFFDLGGHSLVATQIISRVRDDLGVDVPIRTIFKRSTVDEFAAAIDEVRRSGGDAELPPIRPGSGAAVSPLSVPQQQVWFINELAPGNTAYHAQATIRVTGALDLGVLAGALTELTRRHESLRTTYEDRPDGPVQVLHDPVPFPLRRIDLTDVPEPRRAERLEELVRAELATPFDLSRLPLSRWTAVRLAPDEYELILVEHHLVHDGWSVSVLMRELETLYNALLANEPAPLPEPTIQYRDYVRWQRDLLDSDVIERQLAYWRNRLAGAQPVPLPTDRPRPPAQRFEGNLLRLEVSAGLPARIRELCRQEGVSLFMTMYAAFIALLHRYAGCDDVCVASGFANRRLSAAEGLIGMLVNPVVLRGTVRGAAPFRELLAQAKETVLDAAAHQECPFPLVVKALDLERDPSRNPLTQIMFSCHDSAVRNPRFADATSTIYERGNHTAKMDLNIIVIPRATSGLGQREQVDDRITVLWEYNTDLFDEQTMRTMSGAFFRLLASAVTQPDTPVGRLSLMDDRQSHGILVGWNASLHRSLPRPAEPVHRQVEQWARRTPRASAIDDGRESISYGELDRRAAAVAATLHHVVPGPAGESVVGVCLPRSAALIVAEFGILKAGAAFLPIDPDTPDERIRRVLATSGARAVVTSADQGASRALPVPTVVLDEAVSAGATPAVSGSPTGQDDLAYVIFTSGSTGTPKGVMGVHHAFANLVAWHRDAHGLGPGVRTTAVASPGFDFSIWEVWPALTSGATLHLPERSVLMSAPDLREWLLARRIDITLLPTPLAESLFALDWPDSGRLRHLHAAGDRLTARPPTGLRCLVHNSYGPTENTAISTSGPVSAGQGGGLPDIGTPIDGTAAYILDRELNPVPPGAVGELYLGGVGVARGYANRPDLTADRFVPDPYGRPGARLYRTGDLARHRAGGAIAFLGRVDDQVQIRGYRIEPGEITAALRAHESVGDAVTTPYTDPVTRNTYLVGYLAAPPGAAAPDPADLRAYLSGILPGHMVPTAFVVLDTIPLTRNGKVDRQALPAPRLAVSDPEAATPASEWERRLAGIWADVLGLERVGVEDSFFDLGGHSLLLSEVHRRVRRDLGRSVPLVALFAHPTVRAFAGYLESGVDTDGLADAERTAGRRLVARDRRARRRAARTDVDAVEPS